MKRLLTSWLAAACAAVPAHAGESLRLANDALGIEFVRDDGRMALSQIVGADAKQNFLADGAAGGDLWQLVLRRDRGRDTHEVTVTSRASARVESSASASELRLRWNGLAIAGETNALDVEVTVVLRAHDPLSRWRIVVTNRSRTWGLWNVIFPVLKLRPIGGDPAANFLTIGRARGIVVQNPFQPTNGPAFGVSSSTGLNWPGSLNMQFQSLYAADGAGLYFATHDGGGFKKTFYFLPQRGQPALEYKIGHWPANMGWPAGNFRMSYDVCIGPFRGDWFDACQLYRAWATRQPWCARGLLAVRRDVPRWFKEAPAAFYLMNYYGESQVPMFRDHILDYLRFLGMELPVTWYVWKKHFPAMTDYNKPGSPWKVPDARAYPCGNIHDGNYPRLPALPNFADACRAVAAAGAYVQAYVCAQLYDPGLNENAPFAAEAKPNAVRDVEGKLKGERGNVAWEMCGRTPWWQQRMADTITGLIRREHVGGIYFDTFQGGYVQCFDTSHGHSHGGGNDPYLADRQLSAVARGAMKRAAPDAVMTGESPAETAIDLLDGFLYRWSVWPDMAPLFATVYGDYICRHGFRLDVDSDAFYVQAAALFTEGAQMGWFPLSASGRHYLEGFEAGSKFTEKMRLFRKLAHHWRPEAGGSYLAYGQLLRPLHFAEPDPMPTIACTDTSNGPYKDGRVTAPALMSGVFKATTDNRLGVFVVNVSEQPVAFRFELTPDRYPIAAARAWRVSRISEGGERLRQGEPTHGKATWSDRIASHDVMFLEVRRD